MRCLLIGLLSLSFMAVACTPERTPPLNAVISTPVSDLPVSSTNPLQPRQLPTAVADSIIQEADAEYLLIANIYERSAPSVVNIESDVIINNAISVNRGSGFVYDTQGYIITNAHVVQNATTIRVTFNDGYLTEGQIVGTDSFSDLAVIRVLTDPSRLIPLSLIADSDTVRVGQRALAIGNPFGLSSSMSAGIISGMGRTLRSAELIDTAAPAGFQNPSIIQTDAPINPGSSGGPLLNSQGQVIGVTTAIRTDNGIFQGVGFAVPSNTVRRIVPSLIQNGRIDYAWMGISIHPEGNGYSVAGLAEPLNLPVDSGILIRGVTVGGPADQAGLRGGSNIIEVRGQPVCSGGDIIVAINGVYIDNMDELVTYLLLNTVPDDRVTVLVVRGRETFEVPLTLRVRPASDATVRDCAG